MRRERAFMVVVLLLLPKIHGGCSPSSCGNITNITNPFRLHDDPQNCCDERYELGCENNVTLLYLNSPQYHIQAINYDNYTVRVADRALQHDNCSSLPLRSLSRSNFSDTHTGSPDPYQDGKDPNLNRESLSFELIVFQICNHSAKDTEKYMEGGQCLKCSSKGYAYAVGGDLIAEDLEVVCDVKLFAPASFRTFNNHSYDVIHRALAYGAAISWVIHTCQNHCTGDSVRE